MTSVFSEYHRCRRSSSSSIELLFSRISTGLGKNTCQSCASWNLENIKSTIKIFQVRFSKNSLRFQVALGCSFNSFSTCDLASISTSNSTFKIGTHPHIQKRRIHWSKQLISWSHKLKLEKSPLTCHNILVLAVDSPSNLFISMR